MNGKSLRLFFPGLLAVACSSPASNIQPTTDGGATSDASIGDETPVTQNDASGTVTPPLPALTVCATNSFTKQSGSDWVSYACSEACTDWHSCVFGLTDNQNQPTLSARGGQMQGIAFVVDHMAGHFVFTPDGTGVIVSHSGDGGTTLYNGFDQKLQAMSNLKTVSLGWENGVAPLPNGGFNGGSGWFTRSDAKGTSIRALAQRPAAALAWLQQNFAQGQRFGTVGHSMGTLATLGAHAWYGLDSIIDYQMLIGGPGSWDINAGCGRVHSAQGYCDTDVAPCAGNPNSSYGNDDPVCPGSDPTNNCRVPTIMAPSGTGSEFDNLINYVGATTSCAPTAQDSRDATLDDSSMAFTVPSWSFKGRVDFIADEGGAQPPNADQGMGEGHMMHIYAALTGPKGWIDNQGTHHPDAWKGNNDALITAAAQAVIAGMNAK